MYDKNGDGWINVYELTHVMQMLGNNPTPKYMREVMKEADKDGKIKRTYVTSVVRELARSGIIVFNFGAGLTLNALPKCLSLVFRCCKDTSTKAVRLSVTGKVEFYSLLI